MKSLATINSIYTGIHQARRQWALTIIENLKEIGKEIKVLGDHYDPEDGWPKGLHMVIQDDDNFPQDIVIDRVKYEDKEHSSIAVHLCYWDPNKCDNWWSISDFALDDAETILRAIQWPVKVKKGEIEEEHIHVLCYCDTDDDYKGELLVAHENIWNDKTKRQAIERTVRPAFCDEDTFDDEDDEELFQQVIDKILAGLPATFHEYEIYWEETVLIR